MERSKRSGNQTGAEPLPAVPSIRRAALFEEVAGQLERWILAGELAVGGRLPAEEVLAEGFEVSRTVIREALAQLRERGLVETRVGAGTVVKQPGATHLQDTLRRHLHFSASGKRFIENLYEARMALEVATTRLCATRATDEELGEIAGHLDRMREQRSDRTAFTEADLGFHLSIAGASHNPLLSDLLEPLVTVIRDGMYETHANPRAVRDGLRAHATVVEALRSRDPEAAGEAMRRHLLNSRGHFERAFSRKG